MMKIRYILVPACLILVVSTSAFGQRTVQGQECGVEREVSAGGLTEGTYNRLTRIYEDIGDENLTEAYEGLRNLLDRTRREPFEQATVLQALGHVTAQQERYREAVDYFQRAIDINRLPNREHFEMVLQIAYLYHAMDRYRDALDQIELWFCISPADGANVINVWVMKASIHAQLDEFRQALEAIDTAITLSDEPREQWYQLKLGMHFELEEYPESAEVLRILVRMRPESKNYWVQLSSILLELDEEQDARAVLALAYRKGLLDRQTEFLQLASLQQAHNAPRKAAEVMEDGLGSGVIEESRQNWEMAAGAWYEARELERALDAYERAGALSDDGALDLQRAFILTNLERWDDAAEAVARALELGGLNARQRGDAQLLLGMSLYNQGQFDAAIEAFNEATNYGRVERAAREWINHVREERSRRANR
jgi:tetratricopeptide (TPR) repeat protein